MEVYYNITNRYNDIAYNRIIIKSVGRAGQEKGKEKDIP